MENPLRNIPYVIFRVDDILVSSDGACDEDHLNNLEEVLKRLASTYLGSVTMCWIITGDIPRDFAG